MIRGCMLSDVVCSPWKHQHHCCGVRPMSELSDEVKQKIRDMFERYPTKQALTLPALHMVHDAKRCVSNEAIKEIADILELSPAQIHDTLSFYGYSEHKKTQRVRNVFGFVVRCLACCGVVKNC